MRHRANKRKGKMTLISKHENYFGELREQIMNPEKWDSEHFIAFDYEAGLGKTRQALRMIGEMFRNTDCRHRVLWVQLFSDKRRLLDATADEINKHARRNVAMAIDGEDTKRGRSKKTAIEPQVLVITHRMYAEIKKSRHDELIQNRDILIMDEFPNLMREIRISTQDLSQLYRYSVYLESDILDEMLIMFRDKLRELRREELINPGTFQWGTFASADYKKYKTEITKLLKSKKTKDCRELLERFQQLFRNDCYYSHNVFYTYDIRYDYVLLKNNIILDANGFDYRYQLSKRFIVKHQPKVYDYSTSILHHYEVNTGKTALKKSDGFFDQVIDTVELQGRKGVLFVTDMEHKSKLEQTIVKHYSDEDNQNETLADISRKLRVDISVEYHGNLLGKNDWRTFDTCVIVKTPNFDYATYVLTSYFFHAIDQEYSFQDIPKFRHEPTDNIRNYWIAGELYQAIKRISRDNTQPSEIHLFCSNEVAVGIVRNQLPGIKYVKEHWGVNTRSKHDNTEKPKEQRLNERDWELITILRGYQKEGNAEIKFIDVRSKFGEKDGANFKRRAVRLAPVLGAYGIIVGNGVFTLRVPGIEEPVSEQNGAVKELVVV
ncbi:DEAD/DEAH box helicase family protein [Alicyclobacillus sp. ALC3]|uniref:DEAD/DEAH box helicase family protein n=1 Tax=Alicyclobacillus sp. ALC3 TaxID=2796143 RepID=UPI002379C7D1|nr:DEAD/DEAH box helicase family protein [Alicyclobacillus sp. ALC3]WDL98851.1 DEAD/DEAH box helicase family protein [Alicyclobacillus sp. ALC3]